MSGEETTRKKRIIRDDPADIAIVENLIRHDADMKTFNAVVFSENRQSRLRALTRLIRSVYSGIQDNQARRMANLFLDKNN